MAVGLAAVLRRVPLVVAEQNTHPGAANRLLARFARASAVAFEGTPLPRAVVTGNPVRAEIAGLGDARASRGRPCPPRDRPDPGARPGGRGIARRTAHQPGRDRGPPGMERPRPTWPSATSWADGTGSSSPPQVPSDLGLVAYEPVEYEEDMPTALAAADVAVCRSGSGTCFELAAAGLPSILVPSPVVTADQQTGNARRLVDAGAAVLVPDAELDGARLVAEVDRLLGDPTRRADDGRCRQRAGPDPTLPTPSPPSPRSTPVADASEVELDLSAARRIHVTNVGGAGMSAVATLLAEMGHRVTGHDPSTDSPFLGPLAALGVDGHGVRRPTSLPDGVDAVVVSTATPERPPAGRGRPGRPASGCGTGRERSPR